MLTDPTIEFQPGSLLRFKGQLTETLTVKDARFTTGWLNIIFQKDLMVT